jgi:Holliday junction DNA helicase RuvA
MIASLAGTVVAIEPGVAVLEVGGLGLRVLVPASTATRLPPVGERTKLLTHLLVREDARTLYGFASAAELELFERLLGVRGLGPARALALLSGSSVEALRAAIAGGDTASLLRLPGIGRRLAAQIVLDLKDKLGPGAAEVGAAAGADGEVLAWLTAMGFPAAEAQAAVARLPRDPSLSMEERVRHALALMRPE